jgi:hypothetical protein
MGYFNFIRFDFYKDTRLIIYFRRSALSPSSYKRQGQRQHTHLTSNFLNWFSSHKYIGMSVIYSYCSRIIGHHNIMPLSWLTSCLTFIDLLLSGYFIHCNNLNRIWRTLMPSPVCESCCNMIDFMYVLTAEHSRYISGSCVHCFYFQNV